ncbi:phosphate ABC transporter permease, partial [Pseudomonas syringae pv. tagetis]
FKDRHTHWKVAIGGLPVLTDNTQNFINKAKNLAPLFNSASLTSEPALNTGWMQKAGTRRMIAIAEQHQLGMRITDKGEENILNIK